MPKTFITCAINAGTGLAVVGAGSFLGLPGRSRRLAKIGGRRAEVPAEGAVKIGDVAEAALVRDLRDVEMGVALVGEHALGPRQTFGEDEIGKGRSVLFEQLPHIARGDAVAKGDRLRRQVAAAGVRANGRR